MSVSGVTSLTSSVSDVIPLDGLAIVTSQGAVEMAGLLSQF